MNKFNKKIFFAICLSLGIGIVLSTITGCSKLIEIAPPSSTITTGQTFSSNELTESAIAGMYTQLINPNGLTELFTNGGLTLNAGMSADELVSSFGTGDELHYPYESNNLTKEDQFVGTGIWRLAFRTIYTANSIIEGVAASKSEFLDDSTRRQATGEAKFMRAFTYFYLTNLFGDVPLVLSTDFKVNATLPRAPQVQVYQQMVTDLKDAAQLLPADYKFAKSERIRANKYAASALLARVYLYQQDWANAAAQADSVISNSQYGLVQKLSDVFLANSREAILQFSPDVTKLSYGARTFDAYNFVPLVKLSQFPPEYWPIFTDSASFDPASYVPSFYLTASLPASFEAGDKRRVQWIDSVPTPTTAPYFGHMIYFPAKYPEDGLSSASGSKLARYYMVLRLGEQYLISAEAKAQLGNVGGSQTALNAIRSRAGLPGTSASTKEDLLDAILRERRSELFVEWGHRWLDLKRTGKATEVLSTITEKQPWKDYQLLYPLPLSELVANPALKQNPGYN